MEAGALSAAAGQPWHGPCGVIMATGKTCIDRPSCGMAIIRI